MSRIEGRQRVIIDAVDPEIDCGRYPIKRVIGDDVVVRATIFADGHDELAAVLLRKLPGETTWRETPMQALGNDRFEGAFPAESLGSVRYTIAAWVDGFATWRRDLAKKIDAGQDVATELLGGGEMVAAAAKRASGDDRKKLLEWSKLFRSAAESSVRIAPDDELAALMDRYAERVHPVCYEHELEVWIERERARTGAWYELFPRSWGPPGAHGTLRDVAERLDYVAGMGFDVLYLPPIHPVGTTHRKGKNNAPSTSPDDPGSPWAIGTEDGGHSAIDPRLGDFEDFAFLVESARSRGIEVALDIAFQCSPDHPYVKEHPEWFRHRADGTIAFAENPPKKYQDIYPLDFDSASWRELWDELRDVVEFWIGKGISIFRVDNPHTKNVRFWEWMIRDVKSRHPEVIFLSEAFTRPAMMYHLAKIGFTQSYTYFTWRPTKAELTEYFTELWQPPISEFFGPNLWPNTPDILPFHLQNTGRAAFAAWFVLAATLGTSFGIYGPAYELGADMPFGDGREEYLDSEKYEIKEWDLDDPRSLAPLITRVNEIRREHEALRVRGHLRFEEIDNDMLVAYSRTTRDATDAIVVVVNLDPRWRQSGWLRLDLKTLGIPEDTTYVAHDLLSDTRYLWHGDRTYIELDPALAQAHILRLERQEG